MLESTNDCIESNDSTNCFIKLIDFGFATYVKPNKVLTRRCGTLEYAAPEVLKESYSEKCDIWSIGFGTRTDIG